MRISGPKIVSGLINRPTGVVSRVVGRVTGAPSLEKAVAGKTVLLTGASSGIGEAAAVRLGEAGARVLLVARSRDKLEELAAGAGDAHALPCDLSDMDAIDELIQRVLADHGRVDVLVNNAGKSIRRSIHLSYDRFHDFERTMQLNYLGPVRLTLGFLPGMRERGSGQLINVSTTGVYFRVPRFSAYIASKAALEAFSDCIAAEIGRDGVQVSSLQMPLVRTPMITPTKIYRTMPSLSPEQAAEWVVDAIVHRPRRMGTHLGNMAAIADVVSPGPMGAVRSAGYRLVPDSRAARE
ncbi:MAG TPA: SDR family NAD(P)-dependent oxidoreductase [Thermoleophilaceae bacterium]